MALFAPRNIGVMVCAKRPGLRTVEDTIEAGLELAAVYTGPAAH